MGVGAAGGDLGSSSLWVMGMGTLPSHAEALLPPRDQQKLIKMAPSATQGDTQLVTMGIDFINVGKFLTRSLKTSQERGWG